MGTDTKNASDNQIKSVFGWQNEKKDNNNLKDNNYYYLLNRLLNNDYKR